MPRDPGFSVCVAAFTLALDSYPHNMQPFYWVFSLNISRNPLRISIYSKTVSNYYLNSWFSPRLYLRFIIILIFLYKAVLALSLNIIFSRAYS
jgi:hypothetical protein